MTGFQIMDIRETEGQVRLRIKRSFDEPHRSQVLIAFNALLHKAHREKRGGSVDCEEILKHASAITHAPEPKPFVPFTPQKSAFPRRSLWSYLRSLFAL